MRECRQSPACADRIALEGTCRTRGPRGGPLVARASASHGKQVLAFLGAAAGVILAIWSLDAIIGLAPRDIPRFQETRIDLNALFFTGAIALAAGILCGHLAGLENLERRSACRCAA